MRKLIVAVFVVALAASAALAQSQQAPTLRIVSEDGNRLPSELMYGNTKVKPLRIRPGTNQPITINDTDFFVQQQYVDFLSRFPDQSGFAHWQNDINQCGANPQCVEVHRINVSAAFFLSIEFQQTGLLVYKMYKAGFGNLPNLPVPVRRESFMPETRSIASGIIVGQHGWELALENNKQAYALSFVQRAAFTSAFPSTMTADEFVTKLDQNAGGGVISADERAALVGILGATPSDASKRAQVLRAVAQDGDLHQREFNKAFVLMQYFGYLKRNPDALPDADFSGYEHWLSKLNQFGGNYVRAEMVKAFLDSSEYKARF
jgi:hypothetical protein